MKSDYKTCPTCKSVLAPGWFKPEFDEECVLCYSKHGNVKTETIVKHQAEEVVDKGCAGGACTL